MSIPTKTHTLTTRQFLQAVLKVRKMTTYHWQNCFGKNLGDHYQDKFETQYNGDIGDFFNYIDLSGACNIIEYDIEKATEEKEANAAIEANVARQQRRTNEIRRAARNRDYSPVEGQHCQKYRCEQPNNGKSHYCDKHDRTKQA